MMLGLRGFPRVQGGVETHVQNLTGELVRLGCEVDVVVRSPYMRGIADHEGKGARFIRIWSSTSASFEAIVHTFFGVVWAALSRPDILHIHAIGPALFAPLARLLGLTVVVTHHGKDFERQKWGVSPSALSALESIGE